MLSRALKHNYNVITRQLGRAESPMKLHNVGITLAALWGGFYGVIEYSNQHKLEMERMEKVLFNI